MTLIHTAIALSLALAGIAAGAPVANERCPVEPTELAVERHQTTYRGTVVSFCCADCVTEFEKSPKRFLDQLPGLEFDQAEGERSDFQRRVDAVWNAGAAFPGLVLGGLAGAAFLIGRRTRLRPYLGKRALVGAAVAALTVEAVAAHLAHKNTREKIADADLENEIHYSVFQEYGDPPMPSPPVGPPAVSRTYYRGNDERDPALFNGGHYRTTTFRLDLCDATGTTVGPGAATGEALSLRVRFERAPGTPDYFWEPKRMAEIYATRDPGKFHGRHAPLQDAVPMRETETMQSWEFRYPLAGFAASEPARFVRGIVYLCERRFASSGQHIGGRFHYAFQFDLEIDADGRLAAGSDLWMGALYRKRSLRIWEIPESEWLSTQPIPLIEGGQRTSDPELLGIEAHEAGTN